MKIIFVFVLAMTTSPSVFAQQCVRVFDEPLTPKLIPLNLKRVNILKRINNFGYFKNFVIFDPVNMKMNLVVIDIPKDGVIEKRPSLEEYITELNEIPGEMRFVYNELTKDQVLMSRLGASPLGRHEKNLLFGKNVNQMPILENLRKSETIQESYNYEIFQAVRLWLAKPGKNFNVIVIPAEVAESFVHNISKVPNLKIQPTSVAIEYLSMF